MDWIIVSDLSISCRVGVTEEERRQSQRLLVTVELEHDLAVAARTDDLAATIDYDAVARRLRGFGEGREWRLIEALAADIARLVLDEFRPATVTVGVKKFVIPEANHVAVWITRRSADRKN
jgi:dihydroneopterin aldolase